MPTITISVSESLKNELEKFKDRMNVSGICQEALLQRISCYRAVPEDKKQFEEMIIKLREGKMKYENEWEKIGFEEGVSDFSNSDYEGIKDILAAYNDYNGEINTDEIDNEIIGSLHDNFFETYDKTSEEAFEYYLTGYVKGYAEMHGKIVNDL